MAFSYLCEHEDAQTTAEEVESHGVRCVPIAGDMGERAHCAEVVLQSVDVLGGVDVLVNNVATQTPLPSFEELSDEQWLHTFDVNVHSFFRTTKVGILGYQHGIGQWSAR